MKKFEKNISNIGEVSQYYSPAKGVSTYQSFSPLGRYLENTIRELLEPVKLGRISNFLNKIIPDFLSYFFALAEEIVGRGLYVSQNYVEGDDFSDIKPEIKELASKLTEYEFIKNLQYGIFFNDEPRVFRFATEYGDFLKKHSDSGGPPEGGGSSGSSFINRDDALIKCLGEAIERTCGAYYKKQNFTLGSFKELKDRGLPVVNPNNFSSFSEKQFRENQYLSRFRVASDSFLKWTWGKLLITSKNVLVPAQLVYVPYRYEQNEALLRMNITTGAAVHTNKYEALYRGICEVVERDAFTIFYLNKLSPPIVDLENSFDGKFRHIAKTMRRYNLELYVLDMTTDISIPTFFSLLIDRSGIGPAITTGNKTDLDPIKAIRDSITEAAKVRPWVRYRLMQDENLLDKLHEESHPVRTLEERSLLWVPVQILKEIDFFLKGPRNIYSTPLPISESSEPKESFEEALKYFKDKNLEVIAVDTTVPEVKKCGFVSFMVLIPELQHMHLWEEYKCLGGRRLYEVPVKMGYLKKPKKEEELNAVPHPFP